MHGLKRCLGGLAATLLLSSCATSAPSGAAADLIFVNAHVITVDPNDTIAEAVAVRGNVIAAVGDTDDILRLRGANTRVVDVGGRTILPGFIDAHSHIEGMANVETYSVNIQVPPLSGPDAIIDVLRARAAEVPAGTWIWGQGTFNQVMPTREQLDDALPDHPVRLDWSAHDTLINHRAAQIMGLDASYPEPTGMGRYERTATGEVMIIRDAPAPWPPQARLQGAELEAGMEMILRDFYLEKGVTTVYDHVTTAGTRALHNLQAAGRLPTRVTLSYFVRPRGDKLYPDGDRSVLELEGHTGDGDQWLRLGTVKIPVDGVWGTTAYTYHEAWDGSGTTWIPDNHGGTPWTQEELNDIVLQAVRGGWQVQTHANGDRAQDMILDAYAAALAAEPNADPRFRIEHFAHFLVRDERTDQRLQRMLDMGVIPSVQVAFLWRLTDTNVQEPDVDFFPLRTLIDRGMHPALGVDTVGTQNFATSPFFSIERAVHRDTKYGTITQPQFAITPMEAIRGFTIWAAEAGFTEDTRGSLEVGKLADLIVVSENPLTVPSDQIDEIDVDITVIDGRIAYER